MVSLLCSRYAVVLAVVSGHILRSVRHCGCYQFYQDCLVRLHDHAPDVLFIGLEYVEYLLLLCLELRCYFCESATRFSLVLSAWSMGVVYFVVRNTKSRS